MPVHVFHSSGGLVGETGCSHVPTCSHLFLGVSQNAPNPPSTAPTPLFIKFIKVRVIGRNSRNNLGLERVSALWMGEQGGNRWEHLRGSRVLIRVSLVDPFETSVHATFASVEPKLPKNRRHLHLIALGLAFHRLADRVG